MFIEKIRKIVVFNRYISFTVFKEHLFIERIADEIEKSAKILDAGAGQCPYKKFFSEAEYVSQDLCSAENYPDWKFDQINLKSDICNLPAEDGYFDYIICTSVLEHVKNPFAAFAELSRVLRPGGKLFLIVPLTIGEHEDYFRFTQYGLKVLAGNYGFDMIHIEKQGGLFIFLAESLSGLPHYYIKSKKIEKICYLVLYPINFLISFVCYYLNKIDKTAIAVNYECIFEKK
ncbi:MAG TPA: class I SAM-dependent methyltransferase [Candidatus Kapabacteria bacterium]|nr:class I SAM-dependent methyltransferase [Candidatus Kapabacteria bacterium]